MKVLLIGQPDSLAEALKSEHSDLVVDQTSSAQDALTQLADHVYGVVLLHFQTDFEDYPTLVERLSQPDTFWAVSLEDGVTANVRAALGVEVSRLFTHPPEPVQVLRQLSRVLSVAPPKTRLFEQSSSSHSEIHETFLRVNRARIAALLLALKTDKYEAKQEQLTNEAHRLSGTLGSFGFPEGTEPARRVESLLRQSRPLTGDELSQAIEDVTFLQRLLSDESSQAIVAQEPSLPSIACFIPDDTLRLELAARAADFRFRLVTPPVSDIIETCQQSRFELIIVDFGDQVSKLPADLLDCLREVGCPVLAICREPSLKERLRLVQWGVDTVLQPPLNSREILELAAAYLQAPAGTRILALDDDPVFLAHLESIMTPLKVSFFPLSDPKELWTQLQSKSPDVLFLDYELPPFTGVQLCRAVKADPAFRETSVIFASATATLSEQNDAWRAGAVEFLQKGMSRSEFSGRLLGALRRIRDAKGSNTDSLTGLVNRATASRTIKNYLGLGSRRGLPVTLAVLDLDHFKSINDRFGHPMGDKVLREVAGVLKTALRSDDVVSRWGGEEFVAAMFFFDKTQAKERLETALKQVQSHIYTSDDGENFQVSFSAGVAQFPSDGSDLLALYEKADQALYTAKARGRAQVVTASDTRSFSAPVEVVLVEDDHPLGAAIVDELEQRGINCVWFQTADEVSQSMLCEAPFLQAKVVVVDKGLGLVDGLSLVREFRQDQRHKEAKIITCSAQMNDQEIEGAYQLGVFEHISKPFAIPVLVRHIKRALGSRG